MSAYEVRIPDVGDAKDVEVIEVCVEVGQSVKIDDALLVIESDKASMEVPSPVVGTVKEIPVQLGDIIDTGDLVVVLDVQAQENALTEGPVAEKDLQSESTQRDSDERAVESTSVEPGLNSRSLQSDGESERFEVRLPELGDVDDVEVVEVLVREGDRVQLDQPLVVLESDKATMELPAPIGGVVETLAVKAGDKVTDNSLIAVLSTRLVREKQPARAESVRSNDALPVDSRTGLTADSQQQVQNESVMSDKSRRVSVYAGPAVRRLARELGVDLAKVEGTGVRGRIVKDDVKHFVKGVLQLPTQSTAVGTLPEVDYPDFSKFGEIETIPLSRMQARGANNLVKSWLNAVHVTQHDEADVTELEEFRLELNGGDEARNFRLTTLPFVIKACAATLREHPRLNASITPDLKSLILKNYINIGMAVDTPQGLIVPVIRDVLDLGLRDLANEIENLSTAAREQKLQPNQISGASFTVSSLGRIGGTGFTPIINAPEVAILGVARLATKPWWDGEKFVPRSVLPLSLSYDHRAINGAEGGRFMQSLIEKLQDVRHLIL